MSWSRRHTLLAGTASVATAGLGWRFHRVPDAPAPSPPPPLPPDARPTAAVRSPLQGPIPWPDHLHAGVNLAHIHARGRGYGSERCRAQLDALVQHGVRHVALTPFAYQPDLHGTELRWHQLDGTLTDADLRACAADLHARGLRPVLKPHIWCGAFSRGSSRQDIRPSPEQGGWQAWFENYTAFAVAQARLAAQMDAALLVVGLEYLQATIDVPGAWADVAAACRVEFDGPLTYAANWWQEVDRFSDWSAFDLIGVNAYYPLDVPADATANIFAAAWAPHLATLGGLAGKEQRQVVFCEAGVPNVRGAAREPWNARFSGPPAPELPAQFIDGLMRAATPQPWFAGVYWWKWFTDNSDRHGDPYALAGRPAAEALRRWWTT